MRDAATEETMAALCGSLHGPGAILVCEERGSSFAAFGARVLMDRMPGYDRALVYAMLAQQLATWLHDEDERVKRQFIAMRRSMAADPEAFFAEEFSRVYGEDEDPSEPCGSG